MSIDSLNDPFKRLESSKFVVNIEITNRLG